MAQIFRAYKSEVPILIRVCYNNYKGQRRDSTYYEILRISPNATQKEIRDAYIKLSKEMHPDSGKKGNHADFVKINEAYNALNKRKIKKHDIEFKYSGAYATSVHHYQYYRHNGAFKQWEECTMRDGQNKKKYSKEERREKLRYCVWLIIIGSLIEVMYITTFLSIERRSRLQMSKQHQLECLKLLKEYQNKTMEEKLLKLKHLTEKYSMSTTDK